MVDTRPNVEAVYPLTPAQEGILFHVLYDPSSPLYVQQYSVRLEGDLEIETLEQSWDLVTRRHQALRALFRWEGIDRPLQIIRSHVEPEWVFEDWRDETAMEQAGRISSFLEDDRLRGFALDRAPLMRFALFRLGDDRYHFVWSHHHLILDGWSLGLVVDEVMECYRSLLSGTSPDLEPPIRFGDYTAWLQDRDDAESRAAFWSDYLSGFAEPNPLPHLGSGSPERWAHRQAEYSHRFRDDLATRIKDFTRSNRLTLSSIMRGAWAIVLSRYTGDEDVVFGATVSGRPAELPGSLATVGLFINTLPIRVRVDSGMKVIQWLEDIQRSQARMTDFESSPLVEVKKSSDIQPDQQLFESILVMENIPDPAAIDGPLLQREARYHQQSNYPLALIVMPEAGLEVICLYDEQRLEPAVVARMMRQLETVIEDICTRPQADVAGIRLFPPEELEELLIGWNQEEVELSAESILDHIAPHFDSRPGHPAVVGDYGRLTYAELDERSSALAGRLKHVGVEPGEGVALVMGRSPGMVVAMLAVMRAGAFYVPVDPDFPLRRLEHVIENAGTTVALTDNADLECGVPTIQIDHLGEAEAQPPRQSSIAADSRAISGDDLAYVMYTSGSTGEPKGVEIAHRSLLASTLARFDYYDVQPKRYMVPSPFTFDSSVAGIYWTLAAGGTLVLPEPGREGDVAHLSRLIDDQQVSHLLILPTLYQLILGHVDPAKLESLEVVIVAGEPCPPSLVEDHHRLLDCTLFNEYGPTEGTVWATVDRLQQSPEQPGRRIAIGRPIPGSQVYVLDQRLRPVPVGAPGEICIAGPGLSRGYTRQPGLTEERFPTVEIPEVGTKRIYRTGDLGRWRVDGRIDLLGRIDRQVKIRGQRLELEEVEVNIRRHSDVKDAVVVAARAESGANRLIAYVDGSIEPGLLRQHLTSTLPDVMVPAQIVPLSPLPRLANGKVDWKSLPEPEAPSPATTEGQTPMNDVESRLAEIWAEALGRDFVGPRDNFFELGGDSLLSIRIVARANEAGLRITPKQFFEHPTIVEMAAVAELD